MFRGAEALDSYLETANIQLRDFDDGGRLRATITQMPEMTFGRVAMTPAKVIWPRDAMSLDRVAIVIAPEQRFRIESPAVVWKARPGVFLVPPSELPVTFAVREQIDELFYIGATRAVVRDIDLAPGYRKGAVEQVDRGALESLVSFIRSVCQMPIEEQGQQAVQSVATEVVRALVRLTLDSGEQGSGTFERAKAIIERSFRDPRVTVGDIASVLGVSERTVHAAFAERGTTVMRELRAERARAAVEIRLRAPKMSRKDLARSAGFGSISSMLRALRDIEE